MYNISCSSGHWPAACYHVVGHMEVLAVMGQPYHSRATCWADHVLSVSVSIYRHVDFSFVAMSELYPFVPVVLPDLTAATLCLYPDVSSVETCAYSLQAMGFVSMCYSIGIIAFRAVRIRRTYQQLEPLRKRPVDRKSHKVRQE